MIVQTKRKTNDIRRGDIIAAIIAARKDVVGEIIESDPDAINAIHDVSGMNAAMISVYGRLDEIFDLLISSAGHLLDFSHTDLDGDDLLAISISTLDRELVDKVQAAYEAHAIHIINNWPEP